MTVNSFSRLRRAPLMSGAFALMALIFSGFSLAATPGEDGTVTIAAANQVVNGYTTLTVAPSAGATTLTVASVAALALPASSGVGAGNRPLAVGDLLMVYQANGAAINTTNSSAYGTVSAFNQAGKYEFVSVRLIAGSVITIATGPQSVGGRVCSGLLNAYVTGAQVIRVPQYAALTIAAGASVVPASWSGSTGGVVVMDVQGNLLLRGNIAADADGFAGGVYTDANSDAAAVATTYRSTNVDDGGIKGESIAGPASGLANGRYGRGAPANGGGGGDAHNASGGGGANGGTGTWNGTGTKNRGPGNAYDPAWNLEAAGFATSVSPGGGRGGYSFSGNNQNALTTAPGNASWGGNGRQNVGGFGGRPLSRAGDRLFFGGGGGAGDGNNFGEDNGDGNNTSGSGGSGGGIVFVIAGAITTDASGTRVISANGADGGSSSNGTGGNGGRDGSGGGGGGGTIVLIVDGAIAANVAINARGGEGGDQQISGFGNEAEGQGGGGGGGVVLTSAGSGTGVQSAAGGANGTSNSPAVTEFLPNGATQGTAGETTAGPGRTSAPLACALPVSVAYVRSWASESGVEVRFGTATESTNVGFRVFPEGHGVKAGAQLVASHVVDSVVPQDYSVTLPKGTTSFSIEDVATDGSTRGHGPFVVGMRYGEDLVADPIDWMRVQAEAATATSRRAKGLSREAILTIDRDGIFRVTHADLFAVGIDLRGIPGAEIALLRLGEGVPRRVLGDATWGDGSALEFIGRAGTTVYGKRAAYRIARDAAHAVAMPETLAPAKATPAVYDGVDEYSPQKQYSFASPSGTPWFADALLAYRGGVASKSLALRAAPAAGATDHARLDVSLWGVTDFDGVRSDHRYDVLLNGKRLDAGVSDGLRAIELSYALPLASLRVGDNAFQLDVLASSGYDFDLINVTSVRLTVPTTPHVLRGQWQGRHARALNAAPEDAGFAVAGAYADNTVAYRVTADGPQFVRANPDRSQSCCAAVLPFGDVGDEYFVSEASAIARPAIAAAPAASDIVTIDAPYLVITHGAFRDGLAPLIAWHEANGLRTAVVDVSEIYHQFADGEAAPEAIASYVAQVNANGGARYVLIVGGDTYDYDDNLGYGAMSFVPSWYRRTGSTVRYAPTDAPYADVDGDGRPDLAIGRLPVRTRAELDTVIDKTLAYARRADKDTALIVAAKAEPDLDFAAIGDSFATALAPAITSTRAFVDRGGVARTRAALIAQFNAGTPLVSFVGHSGADRWSFDPLFTLSDARALANYERPAAVVQSGCYNTYYVTPQANTLAHGLLFNASGGAALVVGAATLTEAAAHQALGEELYPRLAAGETMGEALMHAKRALYENSPYALEVGLGITLLGDPAIAVR